MSRRIEIELTSTRPDGTWTWRAAGAKAPKGVLDSAILSGSPKVGDVLRAEVEVELDGSRVLSAAPVKSKADKGGLIEILPSSQSFEPVTQQLAKADRSGRGDRGDRRDRPPRRPDDDRPPRGDADRRPRRDGETSGAPSADRRPRSNDNRSARPAGEGGSSDRRTRPNFTPPPELAQRPKPKRLKPGRAHRAAVLADLPEAQRPVAERALQGGIPAVRQAVQEQNARLKAEGKEEIPAIGLIQMAEQLLPKLRVAEWLDRADAAKADLAELALPDLRSVVAASEDPVVARDETTRVLAAELKQALITKQERELLLWLDDITAALGVGRVVRALKLSSLPPKAGVRFPSELATQLADAATASMSADAMPDRWVAILEAAAFAPVRALIKPSAAPTQLSDELSSTIKRLAPALPQIAALFGIEVTGGSSMPKPLRPTRPGAPVRKAVTAGIPRAKPAPPRAESATVELAKPEAAHAELAPVELAPVELAKPEAAHAELAKPEAAHAELALVKLAPVELAPVEVPVEFAAQVDRSSEEPVAVEPVVVEPVVFEPVVVEPAQETPDAHTDSV